MYVSTTGALLKSLRCTPVGNRDLQKFWLSDAWFGNSVLSADPEQVCWEGQHAQLVPYFIIMLLLYAVGYPVAVFIVLRTASNPLVREGWHPKVYGRLYRRFEPSYYWWEIVYLVRRICLTSFRVLMNDRKGPSIHTTHYTVYWYTKPPGPSFTPPHSRRLYSPVLPFTHQ